MNTRRNNSNPSSALMAMFGNQFGGQMPQFAQGSNIDPMLGALMMSAGMMQKRRTTNNQYLAPGQEQGGRGLDGQQFAGLDALHAMQKGRSARYSSPTFSMKPLLPQARGTPMGARAASNPSFMGPQMPGATESQTMFKRPDYVNPFGGMQALPIGQPRAQQGITSQSLQQLMMQMGRPGQRSRSRLF